MAGPEQFPADPTSLAPAASLRTRLASLIYEVLLLTAILFVSSYLFLVLARDAQSGLMRTFFQVYLLAVCGIYFVFCWTRTGQTLPMKTWRLRVVAREAGPLTPTRALWRYLLAIPGMLSGASVIWVPFDRDHQFLHDRLAGTRIVRVPDARH
ncbi:MAG: RDD family protein [Betaproteobacteria bacterium]